MRQFGGYRSITLLLAVLFVAASGAFLALQISEDDSELANTSPGSPAAEQPTTKPEPTPKSTNTPANTPTPEATATPEVKKILGNGKYNTVEEMPISEAYKEGIKKMIEGTEVAIIGDGYVIAIDKKMLEEGDRMCPTALDSANVEKCTRLTSVSLNPRFDSLELFSDGIMRAKYRAFQSQHPEPLTLDEYKLSLDPYMQRGRDVFSGKTANRAIREDAPVVIIVADQPRDPKKSKWCNG